MPGQAVPTIKVADLQTSKDFYLRLGFYPVGGNEAHQVLVLSNGVSRLALYQASALSNLLCFYGADATALVQHVERSGLSLDQPPSPGDYSTTTAQLRDPDGNTVYIVSARGESS